MGREATLQDDLAEETGFSLSNTVPVPDERRHGNRHLTILRVGTLIVGETRELCLMRNISAGGLMAHVYSKIDPGRRIAVEFRTNQQVPGTVVWTRGENVGIQFDESIDVPELLSNPPMLENGWRPRMPRIEIDRMATIRAGADTHWATVLDISLGGIKAEIDRPLNEGGDVVVTLENFRPIPGVVRWSRDGCCGITFNQVLAFGEVMEWLKRGH